MLPTLNIGRGDLTTIGRTLPYIPKMWLRLSIWSMPFLTTVGTPIPYPLRSAPLATLAVSLMGTIRVL